MNDAHCKFTHYAGKRVHLGVCGSVAAFRMPELLRWWLKDGIGVSVALTPSAERFIAPLTFEALGASPVYGDMFSPESPFGHLEPGQTAQAMVVAPATAATLERLAHGAADAMLACQALAFSGPLVLAPAMNPRMWEHPATQANVAALEARGARVVPPGVGGTACGDEGQGRLADLREIWAATMRALSPQDMRGLRVMITLGPTRERWDAMRFWSNPSTGRMGAALALAAWLRGAEVDAVCGPCGELWLPSGIRRHAATDAAEMFAAAAGLWPQAHVGMFTAAVADFAPEPHGEEKFKKSGAAGGFSLVFRPNPDILKTLAGRRRPEQKVLGFAAETCEDMAAAVRAKLQSKGAHIMVGNRIGGGDGGFAAAVNAVFVADHAGREEQWPSMSKADVAWRLCTWLTEI